jgi:SAM-dependent methyltransferase
MPDRIAEHYQRHAHAFDAARRRQFVERGWLDRFLLGVPEGGQILDLGCGAGEPIARYLIDTDRQLTGVDISEHMIALARTRFARQRWIRADMRTLALDERFHGVIAWDSLFHLRPEEQAEMLAKAAAWLEPGALGPPGRGARRPGRLPVRRRTLSCQPRPGRISRAVRGAGADRGGVRVPRPDGRRKGDLAGAQAAVTAVSSGAGMPCRERCGEEEPNARRLRRYWRTAAGRLSPRSSSLK